MSNRYTDDERQINYASATTGIISNVRDIIEIDPLDNTKIKVKATYVIKTIDATTPLNIITRSLDVPITSGIVHNIPPGFTYWVGVKDNAGIPLYNFHFTLAEFDLTEFAIIGRAFTDETVALQLNGVVGTFWWEGWNYGKTLYDFATARNLSFDISGGGITPDSGLLTYTREEGIYWRFMSFDDLKNPNKGADPQTAITAYFTYPSVGAFEQTSTFEVGFFDLLNIISVTAMTRSTSTVTVDTSTNHGLTTGDTIDIDGAVEIEYNGIQIITVVDLNTFTYELQAGLIPSTPATGTITVTESVKTVVPANKWSIYKVFHFASSNFESTQRGKQTYDSLHEAKSRKGEEDLPLNSDLENASFTHIAYVKSGATDLSNIEEVVFEKINPNSLSSGGDPLISSLQGSGLIDWEGTDILEIDTDTAQFKTSKFRIGKVDRANGEIKFVKTKEATSGNVLTKITTQPFTHIAYNIDLDVFVNHTGVFNRGVLGNIIPLGFIWHRDNVAIDRINNMPMTFETSHDYVGQLLSFGGLRQNGLTLSPNGANVKVDLSGGTIEVLGGNSITRENISTSQPVANIPLSFTPVHRAVTTAKAIFGTITDTPDYTVFDDGTGTLAVLSNVNKFGVHYIYVFPFRLTLEAFLIHGSKEYDTFEDAKDGVNEDTPPVPSDLVGGFLVGVIIAKKDTTDLTAGTTALTVKIVDSDRFGSFGGGGGGAGISVTVIDGFGSTSLNDAGSINNDTTLNNAAIASGAVVGDDVVLTKNDATTITILNGGANIANSDLTVSATRLLNLNGNPLTIHDGINTLLLLQDSLQSALIFGDSSLRVLAGGLRLNIGAADDLEINNDPGTVGQVITSAGIGLPPTWENVAAGTTLTNGEAAQSVTGVALGVTFTTITGCSVLLPSAGTYRVYYNARGQVIGGNEFILFRLFDVTGGAAVPNTIGICAFDSFSTGNSQEITSIEATITVTAATTIRLEGSSNVTGNSSSNDANGVTKIGFQQLPSTVAVVLSADVSADAEQLLKLGSDNLVMLDPDDLVSADAGNGLIKGTDGKLQIRRIFSIDFENSGANAIGTILSMGNGLKVANIGRGFARSARLVSGSYTSINASNGLTGAGSMEVIRVNTSGTENIIQIISRSGTQRCGFVDFSTQSVFAAGEQVMIRSVSDNASSLGQIVSLTFEEN